jgi:hypothetical protein
MKTRSIKNRYVGPAADSRGVKAGPGAAPHIMASTCAHLPHFLTLPEGITGLSRTFYVITWAENPSIRKGT